MLDEQKTNIWEGNWSGNTFHRKHICEQTDGGTILESREGQRLSIDGAGKLPQPSW
jgi:hypothetical protein